MDKIILRQGIYQPWQITLYKADGTVATDYTTANTLTGKVWAGDQTAIIANPNVSWIDPTAGTILAEFKATDTASLDAGTYLFSVELTLTDDLAGEVLEAYRADLVLDDSPGSQEQPATYCSYSDLLDYAPMLAKEQTLTTQTGFAEARGRAKAWIDEVILAHAGHGRHRYIKQLLDEDKLIVGTKIKDIAVHKSLSIVFGSAFTASKESTVYTDFAAQMSLKANSAVSTLIAWFDTDGDGYGDVHVDCGNFSMRSSHWHYEQRFL